MNNRLRRARGGFALAGLAMLGLLQARTHGAGPVKPTNTPVTTTIDNSVNGYQVRVESDFKGSYVSTSQVSSLIDTLGDWSLTTYSTSRRGFTASTRSVFFDLTEPVASTNPLPPMQSGYVQAHLIAKCHLVNTGFLQIPAGSSVQCPGSFRFQASNGLWYRFSFQPENFPEVDRMNVTCDAADAAGCRLWTITPGGTAITATDPNPKNVNKLVQIDPSRDTVLADLGDYYLSFRIRVAR